jgi:hypothetical protein
MSKLPETFVLNKFYSYAIDPTFRKHDNTYNAACPVCKEGKSLGKKKRLFFYPESNTFHCFNCSKTWSAYNWITSVCNMSKDEIDHEINSNSYSTDVSKKQNFDFIKVKTKQSPILPFDFINLFDPVQQAYYKSNKYFNDAMQCIKDRLLDTAINKSSNLYISLTDFYHKNRLCIPFYDRNNKIVFYQTRALDKSEPRYLGKIGSDKTVFGIERVDVNLPYIFMFEGPIDAMFVKNGVSLAGLTMTETQKMQLAEFPLHKKIWVLDNPNIDESANTKIRELKMKREYVFKWKLGMSYKDFNEMAIFEDKNEIDYNIIIENLY